MRREKGADDLCVLIFQNRACRVEEAAARAQQGPQRAEERKLPPRERRDVTLAAQPLDVGMAADDARARAGRVHQDAIERPAVPPGVRRQRVTGDDGRSEAEAAEIVAHAR